MDFQVVPACRALKAGILRRREAALPRSASAADHRSDAPAIPGTSARIITPDFSASGAAFFRTLPADRSFRPVTDPQEPSASAAGAPAPPRRKWLWVWGFRLLIALLLAGIAARILWIDVRRIPTSSMVPTLVGDDTPGVTAGDRVLLVRRVGAPAVPPRFAIVAAEHPEDPHREIVKRVVGLPRERIQISDGDLVIGGKRLRKTAERWREQRVPLLRAESRLKEATCDDGSRRVTFDGGSQVTLDGSAATHLSDAPWLGLRTPPTDGYEDQSGHFQPGDHSVEDLELEVQVELDRDRGVVFLELREQGDEFVLEAERTGADGQTTLRIERVFSELAPGSPTGLRAVRTQLHRCAGPRWAPGRAWTLAFRNVDDRLEVEIDGRPACTPIEIPEHHPFLRAADGPAITPRAAGPRWGCYGSKAQIRRVALYRDLHYLPRGRFAVAEPFELGPEELFVLGDLSGESQDSREFGALRVGQVFGRVRAIVSPWSRLRWVP